LVASNNERGIMKNSNKGDIKPVEVKCPSDIFENIIREWGVAFCCEWFGHHADSEFTKETIKTLSERTELAPQQENRT
jgi:hypothetical protein